MSLLDAFSKTDPGRPPAIEDVPDADFEMIFGVEPRVTGGRAVNLRDMAAVVSWRQARRNFDGLANVELDESLLITIMESTLGVPIAWQDKAGRVYIAVSGFAGCYFFPAHVLVNPNIGKPEVSLWRYLISQGQYVPNLPSAAENPGIDVLRKKNERNNPNPTEA